MQNDPVNVEKGSVFLLLNLETHITEGKQCPEVNLHPRNTSIKVSQTFLATLTGFLSG